jgi:flagellar basal body-associated protein FliL
VQYVSPGQFSIPPEGASITPAPTRQQYTQPQEIAEIKSPPSQVSVSEPSPEPLPEIGSTLDTDQVNLSEPTIDDVEKSKLIETESELVGENIPSDEELDAMLGPADEEAVASILEENDVDQTDSISVDELENMDDPEPIAAISSDEPNTEEAGEVEPEDIPDPEPIVMSSFDSEADEEEKKGGGLIKVIIWIVILLIIISGALAGAFYKRKMVVEFFPASNIIFEMIGFGIVVPGQGLKIKSEDPIREERDGKKVTVIKGVITNISSTVQQVPEILLQAVDSKGRVVLTQKVTPEKLNLAPGKFVKFVGEFKKLPKTAKRLDITYGSFVADNKPKKGIGGTAPSTKNKTSKPTE